MHSAPYLWFLSLLVMPFVGFLYWAGRPNDDRGRGLFYLGLAILLAQGSITVALGGITRLDLPVYDLYVYRLDGVFGFQPSFALARLMGGHRALIQVLDVVYGASLLAVGITLSAQIWCREPERYRAMWTFILNALLAPLIYLMFPVCGPRFAFPSFPAATTVLASVPIHLAAAPNSVPSVHASTAFLIVWFSRGFNAGRWLAIAFLSLTLAATLALGQHYLFDLVCSVPYTALVLWLTQGMTGDANPVAAPSGKPSRDITGGAFLKNPDPPMISAK